MEGKPIDTVNYEILVIILQQVTKKRLDLILTGLEAKIHMPNGTTHTVTS